MRQVGWKGERAHLGGGVGRVLHGGGEVGVQREVAHARRMWEVRERAGEAREGHELVAGRGLGGGGHGGCLSSEEGAGLGVVSCW